MFCVSLPTLNNTRAVTHYGLLRSPLGTPLRARREIDSVSDSNTSTASNSDFEAGKSLKK